jgi:hypothetical protein
MSNVLVPFSISELMPETFIVCNGSNMSGLELAMWLESSKERPTQVIYLSRNANNEVLFKIMTDKHTWSEDLKDNNTVEFSAHPDSMLLNRDNGYWWDSKQETPSQARVTKFLSDQPLTCGICFETYKHSGRSCNQCNMDMCRACSGRSFIQNQTCPGCRKVLDVKLERKPVPDSQ